MRVITVDNIAVILGESAVPTAIVINFRTSVPFSFIVPNSTDRIALLHSYAGHVVFMYHHFVCLIQALPLERVIMDYRLESS